MYNPIIPCKLSPIIVPKCCYVGASLVTDHNISKTVRKFYHKVNQVMNDFKDLPILFGNNLILILIVKVSVVR